MGEEAAQQHLLVSYGGGGNKPKVGIVPTGWWEEIHSKYGRYRYNRSVTIYVKEFTLKAVIDP